MVHKTVVNGEPLFFLKQEVVEGWAIWQVGYLRPYAAWEVWWIY